LSARSRFVGLGGLDPFAPLDRPAAASVGRRAPDGLRRRFFDFAMDEGL
jgi:hypothetical protein